MLFSEEEIIALRSALEGGHAISPGITYRLLAERDGFITVLREIEMTLCQSHSGWHPTCDMAICTHPLTLIRQALL